MGTHQFAQFLRCVVFGECTEQSKTNGSLPNNSICQPEGHSHRRPIGQLGIEGPVHTGRGAPRNRRTQIKANTVVTSSITGFSNLLRVLCERGLNLLRTCPDWRIRDLVWMLQKWCQRNKIQPLQENHQPVQEALRIFDLPIFFFHQPPPPQPNQ